MNLPLLLCAAFLPAVQETAPQVDPEEDFDRRGRRVVAKDTFPVFDHPQMLSVAEAEEQSVVKPRDLVLGVEREGEAKCYPLPVMGSHELGNDTVGGIPIAPSW